MHGKRNRKERLESRIQEELLELLLSDLSDPRVQDASISRVEMTGDLRVARIYFTAPADTAPEKVLDGLNRASGFIRRSLAQTLQVRHVPELEFRFDRGLAHSRRIHELLDQLSDRSETPDDE